MNLQARPISSLLDYTFVIPPYQRGYRWDFEQVEALIDDIREFAKSSQGVHNTFYCMQPIVVVPVDSQRFEVVDGQQRLTTIYLILSYLRRILGMLGSLKPQHAKTFRLEMPARDVQQAYLQQEKFTLSGNGEERNIDNFYLREAYEVISQEIGTDLRLLTDLQSFLLTPQPTDSEGQLLKDFNPHVAVIWYEVPEVDAHEAFKRLNAGKIPLTSGELVKALLLQSDYCNGELLQKAREESDRRSNEWNRMELALREESFLGMTGYAAGSDNSLMEMIIDIVADEYNPTLDRPFRRKPAGSTMPDYFNFNVLNRIISLEVGETEGASKQQKRLEAVAKVWERIRKVYLQLRNWHDNREMYHLIGLYSLVRNTVGSSLVNAVNSLQFTTEDTPEGKKTRSVSKTEFLDVLRNEIGITLKINTFKESIDGKSYTPPDKQEFDSPELTYGRSEQGKIVKILEAHNVLTILHDNDKLRRFPFALFRSENSTSLEHIHPQNIQESSSYDDYRRWFDNHTDEIDKALKRRDKEFPAPVSQEGPPTDSEQRDLTDGDRRRLNKFQDWQSQRAGILEAWEWLRAEFDKLQAFDKDSRRNKYFANHLEEFKKRTNVIDRLFGEMAAISPGELHHIKNLALVDQPTNSQLQNYFLDAKRKVLEEIIYNQKRYIPQATLDAFNKRYSAGQVKEMDFWGPSDRQKYFDAVKASYDYFVHKPAPASSQSTNPTQPQES